MSLVLELPQPLEARLQEEARRVGMAPAEFAVAILQKSMEDSVVDAEEQKRRNASSIALLQSWLDKANRPRSDEEKAAAEAEMTDLMHQLNAPRREAGERLHFPDVEPPSRR